MYMSVVYMSSLILPHFATEKSRDATHFDPSLLMPFFIEHLQGNAYPENTACILPTAPIVSTDTGANSRAVFLNAIYAYIDFLEPEKSSLKTPKNLVQAVESCYLGSTRFGLIGLLIQYRGEPFGHMNMLLLDYATNTIERFEPNGETRVAETKILNTLLRNLTERVNASNNLLKFKYRENSITRLGPNLQQLPGTHPNFIGYCVGWSILYAHVRMMNPQASSNEVIDSFLRMPPEELRDYVQRFHTYYEKTASEAVEISFLGKIKLTGKDLAEARHQTIAETTSSLGKRRGSADNLANAFEDLHVAKTARYQLGPRDERVDFRSSATASDKMTKDIDRDEKAGPKEKRKSAEEELEDRLKRRRKQDFVHHETKPGRTAKRKSAEDELEDRLRAKRMHGSPFPQ